MIKYYLKANQVKSYMSTTRENYPLRIWFEGKEYEVKYTYNSGLIMTRVKDKKVDKQSVM